MSKETLTVTLVPGTDGNIDQAASQAAFTSALTRYIADREEGQAQIVEALHTLFDRNLGKSIPMPTLGSMVASSLNATSDNHAALSDRALNYVRANSQGKTVDGESERPDSVFVITKGVRGGCARRADLPVKS